MIINLSKLKLEFIKKAIIEYKVVIDFTKTDGRFFEVYGVTKKMMEAEIKGLERELINYEKDKNENLPERIKLFIEKSKEEEEKKNV